jgi:integrase
VTATIALPKVYTEDLPSGRVRVGFRVPGTRRKVQRTFDYAHEGEDWADDARRRVAGAVMAGDVDALAATVNDVLGRNPVAPAALARAVADGSPTLAEYARVWLGARVGSVEKSTLAGYTIHVDKILADKGDAAWAPIGSRPIADVTLTEVEEWRNRTLAAGVNRPTVNARLKVLRMVFRRALDDRLIPSDPSSSIKFLATDSHRKATLDDFPEVDGKSAESRLLAEFAAHPDEEIRDRLVLFVLLGIYCGLRWEETAALDAASLRTGRDGRHYLFVGQVKRRDGSIRPFTKDGQSREVPIGGHVLTLYRTVALATAPGALLFPWKYDAYRHTHWKGATHRAGLDVRATATRKGRNFGYHQLRHTCGSRLATAGVPRAEIARFLGHADEATTAIYIHAKVEGARHDAALDALGLTAASA